MARKTKINKKEDVVRYEEWTNVNTGETKPFAVINKEINGDTNWWKLWVTDLLATLGLIGNVKIKVLMYIMDNINPYDNTFGGTIREIAEGSKTSNTTVQRVLKILIDEANFLVKVRTGTYQINPNVLAKGSHKKRVGLMVQYDKSKAGSKSDDIQLEGQKAMFK